MSSKKTKEVKRIKKLILVIIILAFIGIVALIVSISQLFKTKDGPKKEESKTIQNENEIISKNVIDVEYSRERTDRYLKLSGAGELFEKGGKVLNTSNILDYLEDVICDTLPSTYDNVKAYTDEELNTYFEKNKDKISKNFGIIEGTQFTNFIKSIKNKNIDITTWVNLKIKKDTSSLIDKELVIK